MDLVRDYTSWIYEQKSADVTKSTKELQKP